MDKEKKGKIVDAIKDFIGRMEKILGWTGDQELSPAEKYLMIQTMGESVNKAFLEANKKRLERNKITAEKEISFKLDGSDLSRGAKVNNFEKIRRKSDVVVRIQREDKT